MSLTIKPLRSVSYRSTAGVIGMRLAAAREAGDRRTAAHLLNCKTALDEFISLGGLRGDPRRDPRRDGPFICINEGEV